MSRPYPSTSEVWQNSEPTLYFHNGNDYMLYDPQRDTDVPIKDVKTGRIYNEYLILEFEVKRKYIHLTVHNFNTKRTYTRRILNEEKEGK